MGINIDIHIYETEALVRELQAKGCNDREMLMKFLAAAGYFCGDQFILINNELWDGYSPYYQLPHLS